ncbi:MAG: ankyrin repeat domain-containing protein [Gammaproteobacteria bacterium]
MQPELKYMYKRKHDEDGEDVIVEDDNEQDNESSSEQSYDDGYDNSGEDCDDDSDEDSDNSDEDSDDDSDNSDQYSLKNDKRFFRNDQQFAAFLTNLKNIETFLNERFESFKSEDNGTRGLLALTRKVCKRDDDDDLYFKRLLDVFNLLDISPKQYLYGKSFNLLHYAIENGYYGLIEYLAKNTDVDFNQRTTTGKTIFDLNSDSEFIKFIKELEDKYGIAIDPNLYDKDMPRKATWADTEEFFADGYSGTNLSVPGNLIPESLYNLLEPETQEHQPPLYQVASAVANNEINDNEGAARARALIDLQARRQYIIKNDKGYTRAADLAPYGSETKELLQKNLQDIDDSYSTDSSSDNDMDEEQDIYDELPPEYHSLKKSAFKALPPNMPKNKIYIPHFRGINYLIDSTNKRYVRVNYKNIAHSVSRPLFSHFAHALARVPITQHPLSELQLKNLKNITTGLIHFWNKILVKPIKFKSPIGGNNTEEFESMAAYIQQRQTNKATLAGNSQQTTDIWKAEIWPFIHKNKDKLLETERERKIFDVFFNPKIPFESILVCTGKTPQKAIAYALGTSVTKINRPRRSDSRQRPDGKAKYSELGVVYIKLDTYENHSKKTFSDTTMLRFEKAIKVFHNYRSETEVAFVGSLEGDFLIFPIHFPSFHLKWSKQFQNQYGLSKQQYQVFQSRYDYCPRPTELAPFEIFSKSWKESYFKRFGVTKANFNAHVGLIKALKSADQNSKAIDFINEFSTAFSQMELVTLRKKGHTVKYLQNYLQGEVHIKMLHEYRRLKSEIRIHLEEYYSKKIIYICQREAQKRGKILAFIDADGELYQYGTQPQFVKAHLTSTKAIANKANEHASRPATKKRKIEPNKTPSCATQNPIINAGPKVTAKTADPLRLAESKQETSFKTGIKRNK